MRTKPRKSTTTIDVTTAQAQENPDAYMWRELTPCEIDGYLTKRLYALQAIMETAKPIPKKCKCDCKCPPRHMQFIKDHRYDEVAVMLPVYRYNLITRVPSDLIDWENLRLIIDEILAMGHTRLEDAKYYKAKFPTLQALRAAMKRLNEAWGGQITVTVPRPIKRGRWQVSFQVVRHQDFDWKSWERKCARERELEPTLAD